MRCGREPLIIFSWRVASTSTSEQMVLSARPLILNRSELSPRLSHRRQQCGEPNRFHASHSAGAMLCQPRLRLPFVGAKATQFAGQVAVLCQHLAWLSCVFAILFQLYWLSSGSGHALVPSLSRRFIANGA